MNSHNSEELRLYEERIKYALKKQSSAEHEESLSAFQDAISITQANGWKDREAETWNQLGVFLTTFDLKAAFDCFTSALSIFQEIGERQKIGEIQQNLGNCSRLLGRSDDALEHYNKALVIMTDLGDEGMMLRIHANLAGMYYHLEKMAETETHIRQAITLSERIKNPKLTARLLIDHSKYQQKAGNFDYASMALDTAERIANEFDDKELITMAMESRGFLYLLSGEYEAAIECLSYVNEALKSSGKLVYEGQIYTNLGFCHEQLGNENESEMCYQKALEVGRKTGNRTTIAINLQNIANIRIRQNYLVTANKLLFEALELARNMNDNYMVANITKDLAVAIFGEGEHKQGKDLLLQAIQTFRKLNSYDTLVVALCEMVNFAVEEKDLSSGELYLLEANSFMKNTVEKSTELTFELVSLLFLAFSHPPFQSEDEAVMNHYQNCIPLITEMKLPRRNQKVERLLKIRDLLIQEGISQDAIPLPDQLKIAERQI